jgi:hypothetical protein
MKMVNYIYYSSSATETYEINQTTGKFTQINNTIDNDQIFDKINFPKNKKIDIARYEVPLYYLYINNDDIFNIFISSKNKSLDDIFRIDKISSKFVGMSLTFNIFNLSLFTYTFFDILEIFFNYFKIKDDINKTTDEKIKRKRENEFRKYEMDIRTSLDNIFADKKEYIESMSDLALHKKNITTNPKSYPTNEKIDCEIEKKITNSKSYDSIIQGFAASIKNLAELLYDFSKDICYEEYKYIFLMSILSYRLKNKLIVGGWGFSIKKTLEQINDRIIPDKIVKNTEVFDINYFPPIYEYLITNYKGKSYGNCMENTILQFFKVLFWDKNAKNYDLSKINNIIKKQYTENFKWFFENIKYERDSVFIDNWTEFIMFDKIKPKYNFISGDVEIDASFSNLFLACYELCNNGNNIENWVDIQNDDKVDFLQKIIKKINLSVKNISVESFEKEDIVSLITDNKIFNIMLSHGRHAFFNDAVIDSRNDSYIILNNISSNADIFNTLLLEKQVAFDKELEQYILLRIMFSPDAENMTQRKFFNYYHEKNPDFINKILETIYSDYRKEFCDKYNEILINKSFLKKIEYDIWLFSALYIRSEEYWINITKRDNILNSWNGMYDKNGTSIWFVMRFVKSIEFWKELAKKDNILNYWKNIDRDTMWPLWRTMIESLIPNVFWEEIAKKDNILDSWKYIKDHDNNTIWYYAIMHIRSEEFWKEISKKDNILDSWKDLKNNGYNTIWEIAIRYLKSEEFWKEIAKK